MEVEIIRKPIEKGNIDICRRGVVGSLEAVLVIDFRPEVIDKYKPGTIQSPVKVIGVREMSSKQKISVWPHSFLYHPVYGYICTSPEFSKLINEYFYKAIMKKTTCANDIIEARDFFKKYLP